MNHEKPASGSVVWGASDDLVEFRGDVHGEIGCYGTDEKEQGVLLICSDGTLLEVKYGKAQQGIWEIKLIQKGKLFSKIEPCMNEEADPYSDIAVFRNGLKWIYAASGWELVK